MLFFKGCGSTPARAIARAGRECATLLLENPSLMVELAELIEHGSHWEAHIRVMALEVIQDGEGDSRKSSVEGKGPKDPEHNISGDPNAWRPPGMEHDPSSLDRVEQTFDTASHAGQVPNVPVRDIVMLRQEGLSEDQIQSLRNLYVSRSIKASARNPGPSAEIE